VKLHIEGVRRGHCLGQAGVVVGTSGNLAQW
jgi:hypothetical protein